MTEGEDVREELRPPSRREFLPTAIAMQSGIVVLAVALGWVLGQRFWEDIRLDGASFLYGLLLSLPLAILAIGTSELKWTWGPFGTLERDFARIVQLFQRCTVSDLFVVSALAGIGEEALFRGVMQNYAGEFVGTWWAVVVTSVIFGALHAISVTYAIGVMIIGVYLGALYVWFDNLLVPIVVHGAYDFIALFYAVKIRGRG